MSEPRGRESKGRARRKGRRRLGSTIVFALSVLTPVLVASGTVLSQLRSYADEVDRRVNAVTAQLVAASGAHEALAKLEADLAFRGNFETQLNGGRASVAVTQIEGEGTADFSDDLFLVRSEGWLNGPAGGGALPPSGVRWYRSVVTTTARPRLVTFPVQQTLALGRPDADVLFSGTSFRIQGDDASTSGSPQPPLPGIGVAGDPSALTNQISKPQQPLITGAAGEGDASVLQTAPVDLTGWIDHYHADPDVLWTALSQKLDGAVQLGTSLAPQVSFAENALQVRGNAVGYGVLVVKGDLRVTGSLDFQGLILVGGTATFASTTGGHTHTHGALLVGGSDVARDLSVVGDVQIVYDSSALEGFVAHVVDGVDVVTWDHDLDAGAQDLVGGGSVKE